MKDDRFRIPKSRYDSVDLYLSNDWINRPEYNDNPLPIDEGIYQRLRDHGRLQPSNDFLSGGAYNQQGLDDLLSKHMAHLFIRDPIVIFSETIDQDNSTSTDHFEVKWLVSVLCEYKIDIGP